MMYNMALLIFFKVPKKLPQPPKNPCDASLRLKIILMNSLGLKGGFQLQQSFMLAHLNATEAG